MAQATLTARVDEKDKINFDAFCSNVGLNTSTAINLFVKAVLRENRIPFEIAQSSDPFFSQSNLEYVKNPFRNYAQKRYCPRTDRGR